MRVCAATVYNKDGKNDEFVGFRKYAHLLTFVCTQNCLSLPYIIYTVGKNRCCLAIGPKRSIILRIHRAVARRRYTYIVDVYSRRRRLSIYLPSVHKPLYLPLYITPLIVVLCTSAREQFSRVNRSKFYKNDYT